MLYPSEDTGGIAMKRNVFDPLRGPRRLLEMLYSAGLIEEALRLSRRLDEAQTELWQEERALRQEPVG